MCSTGPRAETVRDPCSEPRSGATLDHPPRTPHRMTLVSTLAFRILVLALAAVSTLGQIAYMDVLYWQRLGWVQGMPRGIQSDTLAVVGADAVVSVLAAVVAISLVFRRESTRGGRPLAVAVAAWAYLLAYGGIFRLLLPAQDSALRTVFEGHFLVVEALGLAGLLAFSAAFPNALTATDLGGTERLPVGLRTLHLFRTWLLRPWAPWVAALVLTGVVLGLARIVGTPVIEAALNPVMDVARFATLVAVVLNFRASWDAGEATDRVRLNWMVLGMTLLIAALALLIGGNVLISVTGWRPPLNWRPILLNLGLLALLWGSAMAVLYDGRMNPKALVRGTATWAGLATSLLFLSAGLEALFSDTMMARISLPTGVGTLAAVGLFAWIFGATRRLVELIIDQIWEAGLPEDA